MLKDILMMGRIRIYHAQVDERFSRVFTDMAKCPRKLGMTSIYTIQVVMVFAILILCAAMILLCFSYRTYARLRSSTLTPQMIRIQLVE